MLATPNLNLVEGSHCPGQPKPGNERQRILMLHEQGHLNTELSEVTGVTCPGAWKILNHFAENGTLHRRRNRGEGAGGARIPQDFAINKEVPFLFLENASFS